MKDGKLTYYMRWIAGFTAVLIAYGSAKLSVAGIGLGGDLWWLNWVIAIGLFVAEFMVNGEHKELNWLMLAMGTGAYAYSIATNIVGIEDYMKANGTLTTTGLGLVTMYAGGAFMDIFPELTLRWALGESKVGDLLGNLVKTYKNPEMLTKSFTTTAQGYNVEPQKMNSELRKQQLHTKYRQPTMDEDVPQIPQRPYIRPQKVNHTQRNNTLPVL